MGLIGKLCELVDCYLDEGHNSTTNLMGFGEKLVSVKKYVKFLLAVTIAWAWQISFLSFPSCGL